MFGNLTDVVFQENRTSEGKNLAVKMEGLIFAVADERFFYRDLEKIDTPTIDAHADDDDRISLQDYSFAKDQLAKNPKGKTKEMRKIAYRYRRIRDLFSTPNAALRTLLFLLPLLSFIIITNHLFIYFPALLNERQQAEWLKTYEEMNHFTDNWLEFAAALLQASKLM